MWRQPVKRYAARMLLAIAACALAGCGAPAHPAPVAVLSLNVNAKTHQVTDVNVGLPSRMLDKRKPVFHIKSSQGDVTTWQVVYEFRDGPAATAVLGSSDLVGRPTLDDWLVTYVDDPTTGKEYVAGVAPVGAYPRTLTTPPPLVANSRFSEWTHSQLEAWALSNTTASYDVVRLLGAESGIRVSIAAVPRQTPTTLEYVSLDQALHLTKPSLRVRLRPYQECEISRATRQPSVLALAGIRAVDEAGREAVFCVAARRRGTLATGTGRKTTIVFVPGRIGSWNNIIVDLDVAWPGYLKAGQRRTVKLGVLAEIIAEGSAVPWATVDISSIEAPR